MRVTGQSSLRTDMKETWITIWITAKASLFWQPVAMSAGFRGTSFPIICCTVIRVYMIADYDIRCKTRSKKGHRRTYQQAWEERCGRSDLCFPRHRKRELRIAGPGCFWSTSGGIRLKANTLRQGPRTVEFRLEDGGITSRQLASAQRDLRQAYGITRSPGCSTLWPQKLLQMDRARASFSRGFESSKVRS